MLFTGFKTMSENKSYTIDPAHSRIYFSVKHMMFAKVRGEFQAISGTISGTDGDAASLKVAVEIAANSLSTGNDGRDNHVKSADFLNVEAFPTIAFAASGTKAKGDGYEVTGDLTMHGVTKPVTLTVDSVSEEINDPWGNRRIAINGSSRLNRNDWGITIKLPMEGGGVIVGDEITFEFEIQCTRSA